MLQQCVYQLCFKWCIFHTFIYIHASGEIEVGVTGITFLNVNGYLFRGDSSAIFILPPPPSFQLGSTLKGKNLPPDEQIPFKSRPNLDVFSGEREQEVTNNCLPLKNVRKTWQSTLSLQYAILSASHYTLPFSVLG